MSVWPVKEIDIDLKGVSFAGETDLLPFISPALSP